MGLALENLTFYTLRIFEPADQMYYQYHKCTEHKTTIEGMGKHIILYVKCKYCI